MIDKILRLLKLPVVRYLIMAIIIVSIEVGAFFILNSILKISYLLATPLSMAIGIILNWYFGRKLIFTESRHESKVEFILVVLSSLGGVGLQLLITFIAVEKLGFVPLVGKLLAIGVTFFYNFLIRRYYIYGQVRG